MNAEGSFGCLISVAAPSERLLLLDCSIEASIFSPVFGLIELKSDFSILLNTAGFDS